LYFSLILGIILKIAFTINRVNFRNVLCSASLPVNVSYFLWHMWLSVLQFCKLIESGKSLLLKLNGDFCLKQCPLKHL
jgi:hypothetical protein